MCICVFVCAKCVYVLTDYVLEEVSKLAANSLRFQRRKFTPVLWKLPHNLTYLFIPIYIYIYSGASVRIEDEDIENAQTAQYIYIHTHIGFVKPAQLLFVTSSRQLVFATKFCVSFRCILLLLFLLLC